MSQHDIYDNPLIDRYASVAMCRLWSPQRKHATWRRLWLALAEAQHELGLDVTAAQLDEMRGRLDQIDFKAAADYEAKLRHDVMAHVHAFGDQCPAAKGVIHLGATSCFVTDNTDLLLIREALRLVQQRLAAAVRVLARFAKKHRDLPCLGFTHLQPAQPTTVGKRAALWCYDLILDLEEVEHRLKKLKFRGVKGTTGTQATFLTLFEGDHDKVEALDQAVTKKMGFEQSYPVTGQTYSRKIDAQTLDCLSGIAQSAHKAGNDLRLLQSRKELEEPFGGRQIGSSAMAYKRNPMRSERMCALARFVMSLATSAAQTAATQWLERTLDDSANRRLTLPQAFLAVDAVLILYRNIVAGIEVHPRVVEKHLRDELPFMATEEILMAGVRAGGDRQELHERIREHSQHAARRVKEDGEDNDLIARLTADPAFARIDLSGMLDGRRFIGRAPQQVQAFLRDVVDPLLARHGADEDAEEEPRV